MNSASGCNLRGSIPVLSLVLVSILSTMSLAGLSRTGSQSQLAVVLAHQALLQSEARRALVIAARHIDIFGKKHAQLLAPGCPERCDWQNARSIRLNADTSTAYIAQQVADDAHRFLISVRATHPVGGEFIAHGLFDTETDRFRFVK